MKKIIIIIFFIFLLFSFYKINWFNYERYYIEVKNNIIEHPEHLPKKEIAKLSSLWFENLKADYYWLNTVQYIWDNAVWSEYKKYLYIMLDLITELNPYFEHPYIIWQLLIPSYNGRYENLDANEQEKNIKQWIDLWLKWVNNFCDMKKVQEIINENDLNKILNDEKYKNPCKTYSISYYLAYIYYFYNKNPLKSSDYYKVASANDNSVAWARIMASIMKWKWWDREKSILMFLNLAKEIEKNDTVCTDFSTQMEKKFNNIILWNEKLDYNLIINIEKLRKEIFEELNTENEETMLSDTKCKNFANKAIREINLLYIENWNKKFILDNNWKSSLTAKELYEKKYIDYLPVDFQQYEDYWIIYIYNKDTWNFDYEMWKYEDY